MVMYTHEACDSAGFMASLLKQVQPPKIDTVRRLFLLEFSDI